MSIGLNETRDTRTFTPSAASRLSGCQTCRFIGYTRRNGAVSEVECSNPTLHQATAASGQGSLAFKPPSLEFGCSLWQSDTPARPPGPVARQVMADNGL